MCQNAAILRDMTEPKPFCEEVTTTRCTTVRDVYGKDFSELKAPAGYEFTGEFRLPTTTDVVLHFNKYDIYKCEHWNKWNEPRLILRKLPTPQDIYGPGPITAPKGYKLGEFVCLGVDHQNAQFLSNNRTSRLGVLTVDYGRYRYLLEPVQKRRLLRVVYEESTEPGAPFTERCFETEQYFPCNRREEFFEVEE